jgi:hypothetical protein
MKTSVVDFQPDPAEIGRFLTLLGKPKGTARLRAFFPSGDPRKADDKGRKGAGSIQSIQEWQREGRGVYVVVNDGGDKKAEITDCRALFCEWDDRPMEWQVNAWQELGLPEPTFIVATGGRSAHLYWVLNCPITPQQWQPLQARLLAHAEADTSIGDPPRVMRLPGTWYMHPGTQPGEMVRIIHESGKRYEVADLEASLPLPEPPPPAASPPPAAPLMPGLADAVPLAELLPRDQFRTWEQGAPEGQRNQTAFSLACSLLAVHDAATASGLLVTGTPEQALVEFGQRCSPPIDDREINALLRSACSEPRTTDPGWPDRLRYHLNRKARDRRNSSPRSTAELPSIHGDPPSIDADGLPTPEPLKPAPKGYFTCLGFDADGYYYQPCSTGQVVRLGGGSHTSTNLVRLAPLSYWETLYSSKTGVNWTWAAASLFEQQAEAGVYSPDRIRGRGAWWDDGRTVLHMGDRLVVDRESQPITRTFKSAFLYQRSAALIGPGQAAPLSDDEALILCELAERFHWEVPASGLLLAGWVTLAPICGALRWRPHIWLTASAGSGKSAILDRYVSPLLGDMGLHVAGNTSEAGLRQTLRADALPVVFDEAESNEKADQTRMQSILALARVASSESHAHMLKGSPAGDVTRFTIRSMFMMSSIATALKQGADRSRFAQLTLRNPTELPKAERMAHWQALDRDLDRFIGPDAAKRLLARTMGLIPTIRASVAVFTRVAAERFDSQRLGDQYGTLLAGGWSLMSSEPVTPEQARALIDQNDWEPYSQTTEVPDEERCIQHILQHQVRVETDHSTHTRTLGELVGISSKGESSFDIASNIAEGTLGRFGLKVEGDALLISNTAQAIASILRDTAWGHSWGTLLARLPGASKAGVVRFKGLGATSRAVRIPLATL